MWQGEDVRTLQPTSGLSKKICTSLHYSVVCKSKEMKEPKSPSVGEWIK